MAGPAAVPVVVVVVPGDAARGGDVVRAIEAGGTRAALFLGDPTLDDDRAALDEMIAELFTRDAPE